MTSNTFMSLIQTECLFGPHTRHVSVTPRRLPDARLLWLNRRAMHIDPQWKAGQNLAQYQNHLLQQCAYAMPDEVMTINHSAASLTATADRYGGDGIGRNGGSGRAVFLNGYHIKGIGRTPLISPLTDKAHASGGAYLEECAREAVLSEIVEAEFPYGSVPVLAIIDTGFIQIWDTDNGPKLERRCLLVRPAFLRPAHFMRALDYIGNHHHDGMVDAQRVALMMEQACTQYGADQFSTTWVMFWKKWAEQLAYGFVHRLNHGGNSESNISMDGRLLDFGGMTALPSWARITVTQGGWPAGADMHYLIHAQQPAAAMLAKHLKQNWNKTEKWQSLTASAFAAYKKTVFCEVLRMLGLTRTHVNQLLGSELSAPITASINRLLAHYMREQFAIFDGMPEPHFVWDLPSFWHSAPPRHLLELGELIERAASIGIFGDTNNILRTTWAARSHMLSQTRTGLFRDNIKEALYRTLDGAFSGENLTEEAATRVIDNFILRHRIDSKIEPPNAAPLGFASGNGRSFALFKDLINGEIFAMDEYSQADVDKKISVLEIRDGKLKLGITDELDLAIHLPCDDKTLGIAA